VTDTAVNSRTLTLVFSDLADSTALKQQLGDLAVGELISRHRMHVTTIASSTAGRIIDWAGDGCFLTFQTPTAAVEFALRLQQAHQGEPDLPGVRIGVHMGEVSEGTGPGGDVANPRVEGLAVDLAARICGLARPAQVLMSAGVADSARQRLNSQQFDQPVDWRSHGTYALKGYDGPLEILEVGCAGVASFAAPLAGEKAQPVQFARALPANNRLLRAGAVVIVLAIAGVGTWWWSTPPSPSVNVTKSVAVLPFVAMSSSESDGYFADGLTEEILNALTTVPGLLVTARTSSFHFKGKNLPIPEIAAQLGVAHILEGSLRPAGDKVRISAQLIRAIDGTRLWSETYDRAPNDVLTVQSEVAQRVAGVLGVFLDDKTREAMITKGVGNAAAFVHYQKGARLFYEGHAYGPFAAKAFEAQQELAKAIAEAPDFSDARLMHAVIYERLLMMALHRQPTAPFPERSAAELQQLFNDDLAEAMQVARTPQHRAMLDFLLSFSSSDWSGLSAKMDAMLDRRECVSDLGWTSRLVVFGKIDAVTRFTERRAACDPFDPGVYGLMIGLHTAGKSYPAARAAITKGRELFGPRPPYAVGEFILAVRERRFVEAERLLPAIGNDRWLQLMLKAQSGDLESQELNRQIRDALLATGAVAHPILPLLTLAAWRGDRVEATRLAAELDEDPFGTLLLVESAMQCECGSPFPLEAAPNFSRKLEQAGLEWAPPSLPWPDKDW
jgi:adenylate cyclase